MVVYHIFMVADKGCWMTLLRLVSECKVRWSQVKSEKFSIKNGTRQGAILSPVFWAVYCDLMIQELRQLGVGAHVAGMFMGVACYADDVVLVAPCQQAMQMMLSTVENFAHRFNISFSTDADPKKSKSKCIFVVGKKRNLPKPASLELCGNTLPWVQSAMSYMKVAPWTMTLLLKGPNSSTDQFK